MRMTAEQFNELIKSRRAIFPSSYIDKEIPRGIIEQILENANWAPSHRRTEPWRFKVFRGEARGKVGAFLAAYYKANTDEAKFSEMKYKKTLQKALKSSCIIAICMQRDPEERVPEWEELAATACAVQNMWLSCTAYNIGCYWSSPKSIKAAGELLGLKEAEKCLGFMYMGYHALDKIEAERAPIAEKLEWFED